MRFVWERDQWVPSAQVAKERARFNYGRSDLPAPMIIRDSLDGVVNPCDGKPYDSKSAYYRTVKDKGCVIIGNEAKAEAAEPIRSSRAAKSDIEQAIAKVAQGYKPQPARGIDG